MIVKSNKSKIFIFILLFNVLWLVRVFFIGKTQNTTIDLAISVVMKFLIFVAYPYFYIKYIYKENPLTVTKLNTDIKKGVKYGIVGSIFIIILGIVIYFNSNGKLELKTISLLDLFFTFVFAAFFEEIAFRGFILNGSF